MLIPAQLQVVLRDDADRLLDRLNEMLERDFADARENNSRQRSPDVLQAAAEAHDEMERLLEMIREADGRRYFGNHMAALPANSSVNDIHERGIRLVRTAIRLLRTSSPQVEEEERSRC
jgi:hypothetical protein